MSSVFQYPHLPIYAGGTPHDYTETTGGVHGRNLGLYTAESTQRYVIGARSITWDGRVYKYCKAAAAVVSYHGAGTTATHNFTPESAGTVAIGDTYLDITETGFVDDELAGCYLILYGGSDHVVNRVVISNDASLSTTTRLYLDGPVSVAITTPYAEIFNNPYKYITNAPAAHQSTVCVPAVNGSAADFVWGQTWGPCVVSPGESVHPPENEKRELVWGENYCVFKSNSAADTYKQHAGFLLNSSATQYGPLIMLQISV